MPLRGPRTFKLTLNQFLMKMLHDYIAITREFNKVETSDSGIIHKEKIPQKLDRVVYSEREDVKVGDLVAYKKHTDQYMEKLEDGTERKLWIIHPDDLLGVVPG